jgi:regulator of protease activity HflC (stomatin/prohibitin superfamily)
LKSEGEKQAQINLAEAEKRSAVMQAEGKAEAMIV